jgi:hypothetical protein
MARMAKPPARKRPGPRKRRADTGGVHAWVQVRVDPDVRKLAEAGAAARNVTLARYIEQLVQADPLAREYLENQRAQGALDFHEAEAS